MNKTYKIIANCLTTNCKINNFIKGCDLLPETANIAYEKQFTITTSKKPTKKLLKLMKNRILKMDEIIDVKLTYNNNITHEYCYEW